MTGMPQTRWSLILLIFTAGLFAAAQFAKLSLNLTALAEIYPDKGALVAGLISVLGMVGIVFGVVAGGLVARVGLRRALLGGLCLGGAVSLLQAMPLPFWIFAATRIVEGVAHLAIVVAAPALMAAISTERDRPVVMGLWAAFFGVSFAITAQVIALLAPFGGFAALMLAHGGGMIVIAALLALGLPSTPTQSTPRLSIRAEHRAIYTSPRLLIAGAGFVWYTLLYIALLAVLPGVLNLAVWAGTAMPLTSLIGTFGAGFVARAISPVKISVAGFAGSAVIMVLLAIAPGSVPLLLALMLVMGVIPGACFATITAVNDTATDRARATGAIAQLGNVGTTLGTPIFVILGSAGGIFAITAGVVIFCVVGILSLRILMKRMAA